MPEKEKIILAVVYKTEGTIGIEFPNERDVFSYELYGFLKCYLEDLEVNLIDNLTKDKEE